MQLFFILILHGFLRNNLEVDGSIAHLLSESSLINYFLIIESLKKLLQLKSMF